MRRMSLPITDEQLFEPDLINLPLPEHLPEWYSDPILSTDDEGIWEGGSDGYLEDEDHGSVCTDVAKDLGGHVQLADKAGRVIVDEEVERDTGGSGIGVG